MKRLGLLLLLPLLALDCLGNVLIGGSPRDTLSGEAWNHRAHYWWGWTHRAIDKLFFWQRQHCRAQSVRERRYGSVWAAWRADWINQGELNVR